MSNREKSKKKNSRRSEAKEDAFFEGGDEATDQRPPAQTASRADLGFVDIGTNATGLDNELQQL